MLNDDKDNEAADAMDAIDDDDDEEEEETGAEYIDRDASDGRDAIVQDEGEEPVPVNGEAKGVGGETVVGNFDESELFSPATQNSFR